MSGYRLVSVERTRVGRVKVVHLTGEVDRLNVPDLDGFLAEIAAGTDDVVVGLGGVTWDARSCSRRSRRSATR